MIWIFNLERASASVCDNYNDVFHYILSLEQQDLLPSSQKSKKDLNCLDFVSEAEKKQWCLEFCKKHKYDIIETPTHAVNATPSTWSSQSPGQLERYKHAS